MSLFRCNCKQFNVKINNIRNITIKKIILSINKKLKNKFFENINLFLIDSGGLLDEYKIIKNLKFSKNIKNIKIYLIEKLNKFEILKAQEFFKLKLQKKLKNFKIFFYNFKILNIKYLFKNFFKNNFNFFISIDPLLDNISKFFSNNDYEKFNKKIIKLNNTKANYSFDYFLLHSFDCNKNDLNNLLLFYSYFSHYSCFYYQNNFCSHLKTFFEKNFLQQLNLNFHQN